MPMGSTFAQDLALDASYGDSKAAIWPDPVYLGFANGDPSVVGYTELTGTAGIDRISLANATANFADASGGAKDNASLWSSAASTDAWAEDADHWFLADAAVGGNILDTGAIVDDDGAPATISVVTAGTVIQVPVGNWELTHA